MYAESRGLIGWIKRKISSQEKHPVNGLAQDGRSCLHGSSGPPTMTGTLHRLPAEPQYQDNPEEDLGFNGIPSLPNLNQDASHQLELRDYSSNASYTTHRQPGPPREPFDQQIQAPSHSHSTLDAIPVPALAFNNTLHFVATEKNEEKDDNEDMEDQGDMGTVGR
ncbi:hypothetical protein WG66_012750 [Moniliophthora roreri]|nr:hypothetical protein WG66_012750 [Moniliophthora roreri]